MKFRVRWKRGPTVGTIEVEVIEADEWVIEQCGALRFIGPREAAFGRDVWLTVEDVA